MIIIGSRSLAQPVIEVGDGSKSGAGVERIRQPTTTTAVHCCHNLFNRSFIFTSFF